MDTHPRRTLSNLASLESLRRRYLGILRVVIHVRSETERIVKQMALCPLTQCISDLLVRFAIRWDQSPWNWHRRPFEFGTNP